MEIEKVETKDLALCCFAACIGDSCGSFLERLQKFRKTGSALWEARSYPGDPSVVDVKAALSMPGGGFLRVAKGQVTDDGELTVSLFNALFEHMNCDDSMTLDERIATHYAKWARTQPFDMGITTGASIGIVMKGDENPDFVKESESKGLAHLMREAALYTIEGRTSQSNGSLMRCSPIGVYGYKLSDEEIHHLTKIDSALSHPHPNCVDSCACYCIAISHLLLFPNDAWGAYYRALAFAEQSCTRDVFDWLLLANSKTGVPTRPREGHCKIAFVYAFRCLLHATSFVHALEQILSLGRDTDTNACIVCGLTGARFGFQHIPKDLKEAVLYCKTEFGRPRPEFLHPKLIFENMERFLSKCPDLIEDCVGRDEDEYESLLKGYEFPQEWPYSKKDFERKDEANDQQFYDKPRFVHHISTKARSSLFHFFRKNIEKNARVLDVCSSWVSHLPSQLDVVGVGLNMEELKHNVLLTKRFVQDLNKDANLSTSLRNEQLFDCCICVVSIDYLTNPLDVLKSMRAHMKEKGKIFLVLSNRMFPSKAVRLWRKSNALERVQLCATFLRFAGFKHIDGFMVTRDIWRDNENDSLWIVKGEK